MKRRTWIALGAATLAVVALFAWGTIAGAKEVMGIVTGKGAAVIRADEQMGATTSIVVAEAKVPRDAFIVIHTQDKDGMPGKRIGYVWIPKGVSRDVEVKLDPGKKLSPTLIASLHIDRGDKREFEYNMKTPDMWPDKPFYVDGMEVATEVEIAEGGSAGMGSKEDESSKGDMDKADEKEPAKGEMDEGKTADAGKKMDDREAKGKATIEVDPQPVRGASVTIAVVMVPADGWVVVHRDENGSLGRRVGVTKVRAGENRNVVVQLDPTVPYAGRLLAAVHADTDTSGLFEYDRDSADSADPAYKANGKIIVAPIELR